MQSLKDISWQVDEPTYRQDKALSYSTLAKYERGGFSSIETLFDKVDSPSLLRGSLVDTLLTEPDEFNKRFVVMDIPKVSEPLKSLIESLALYKDDASIVSIDGSTLISFADTHGYQKSYNNATREKNIITKGGEYYAALKAAETKTVVPASIYTEATEMVTALYDNKATNWYLTSVDWAMDMERFFQLKFKTKLDDDIEYRCMFDLLLVNHKYKEIIPCDIKTTSKPEYEFYKSFIEWNYDIQARLYSRILKKCLGDTPFAGYAIKPMKFIVVGALRKPLVWEWGYSQYKGDLTISSPMEAVLRDPETIGKELSYYLTYNPTFPNGVYDNQVNKLTDWVKIP